MSKAVTTQRAYKRLPMATCPPASTTSSGDQSAVRHEQTQSADAAVRAAAHFGVCLRCDVRLSSLYDPTNCGYCDPLCPHIGYAGHLWQGDEEAAWAAYEQQYKDALDDTANDDLCDR